MADELGKQIRKWIDFACDRNNVPELKHKIDFEFNTSFTRRLGDARWDRRTKRGRVRLSTPLWQRATDQEKYETVVHEACHVVVGYLNEGRRIQPHGEEWKQAMWNCDLSPDRTHCVDRKGLMRKQLLYVISDCPNQDVKKKCRIKAKQFKQLEAGATFSCRVCSLKIGLHDVEEDDYEEES